MVDPGESKVECSFGLTQPQRASPPKDSCRHLCPHSRCNSIDSAPEPLGAQTKLSAKLASGIRELLLPGQLREAALQWTSPTRQPRQRQQRPGTSELRCGRCEAATC